MMILNQLIKQLKESGITIEAFESNKTNAIVYQFVNLTSDKIKRQDRLEITIIDTNYQAALVTSEQIKKSLLTLGDDTLQKDINSVELSGGGTLKHDNTKTYHIKQIYIIKSKER